MQFIQGLGLDQVLEELRRIRDAGGSLEGLASVGPLRVSGSSPSAADLARTFGLLSEETAFVMPGETPSDDADDAVRGAGHLRAPIDTGVAPHDPTPTTPIGRENRTRPGCDLDSYR